MRVEPGGDSIPVQGIGLIQRQSAAHHWKWFNLKYVSRTVHYADSNCIFILDIQRGIWNCFRIACIESCWSLFTYVIRRKDWYTTASIELILCLKNFRFDEIKVSCQLHIYSVAGWASRHRPSVPSIYGMGFLWHSVLYDIALYM